MEIDTTIRGEVSPTLYSLLNTTKTAMGARLLRHWLHHPLRDRALVAKRHEAVAELIQKDQTTDLHAVLKQIADIERITARVALRTARPRDLSALRDSLNQLPAVEAALQNSQSALLQTLAQALQADSTATQVLAVAIKDELDVVPYTTSVGTQVYGLDGSARDDATVVARLKEAGAIIIGKANMHEIGIGVTGANPAYKMRGLFFGRERGAVDFSYTDKNTAGLFAGVIDCF